MTGIRVSPQRITGALRARVPFYFVGFPRSLREPLPVKIYAKNVLALASLVRVNRAAKPREC